MPAEDVTITAQYEVLKFTVKFINYDGSVVSEQTVPYGDIPKTPTANPSKPYNTFKGWDREVTAVTSDNTIYTAIYEPIVYTIRIKPNEHDWDLLGYMTDREKAIDDNIDTCAYRAAESGHGSEGFYVRDNAIPSGAEVIKWTSFVRASSENNNGICKVQNRCYLKDSVLSNGTLLTINAGEYTTIINKVAVSPQYYSIEADLNALKENWDKKVASDNTLPTTATITDLIRSGIRVNVEAEGTGSLFNKKYYKVCVYDVYFEVQYIVP